MRFSARHHYEHPLERVFEVLTDFESVKAKYEALGHSTVTLVERYEEGGGVTIVTRRIVPLDVPGFAKKVLSPKNTVVQTDRWSAPSADGTRTGRFTVDAKGVPVKVGGDLRLTPDGDTACISTIDATVECRVPLIGGKIADLVGADTRKAVEHEQGWNAERLG